MSHVDRQSLLKPELDCLKHTQALHLFDPTFVQTIHVTKIQMSDQMFVFQLRWQNLLQSPDVARVVDVEAVLAPEYGEAFITQSTASRQNLHREASMIALSGGAVGGSPWKNRGGSGKQMPKNVDTDL